MDPTDTTSVMSSPSISSSTTSITPPRPTNTDSSSRPLASIPFPTDRRCECGWHPMVIREMKSALIDITLCYESALDHLSAQEERNALLQDQLDMLRTKLETQAAHLRNFSVLLQNANQPIITTDQSEAFTVVQPTDPQARRWYQERALERARNFFVAFGEDGDLDDLDNGVNDERRMAMEAWAESTRPGVPRP